MAVLHVVNRIFAFFLDGERQIERERRLYREHDEEKAGGVDSDFVDYVVERHDFSGANR